jgi:5-methylcytosine-specific restriction endonuclease McrA
MTHRLVHQACVQCSAGRMVAVRARPTSGLCKRCTALRAARIKSEIYALRRMATWKPKSKTTRPRLTQAERVARLNAADPIRIEQKPCRTCGHPMEVIRGRGSLTPGSNRHVCGSCRVEALRRARKAAKQVRRAREKGSPTIERVDSVQVFSRDGWRCQSCGCDTPRILMGTLHDSAPELDHAVPLSRGGAHTSANVQCLCRLCNQIKSDMMPDEFDAWMHCRRGGHGKVEKFAF